MSTNQDPLIGVILIGIAVVIILGLTIYSLIQAIFLGRKRYVIGQKPYKGQDTVINGANLSRDMTVTQATMTGVGAMIGAEILACLAILGMSITIIGIPFAVYFAVRWDFIWQAALVERVGPRAALSRSSDFVRANWWRVVGIMLVVIIIASVIGLLLALILGLIPILGPIIETILLTPIPTIAHTLLYYDLRVRKEQYGLKSLAGELDIKIDGDLESTDTIPIS